MTGTEEDRRHEACSAKMIAAQREVGNSSRPVTRVLSQPGPGSSSYRMLALKDFRESLHPTLSFYDEETEAQSNMTYSKSPS